MIIERMTRPPVPSYHPIVLYHVPSAAPGAMPGAGAPGSGAQTAPGVAGAGGPTPAYHAFRRKQRRPLLLPRDLGRKAAGDDQKPVEIGPEEAFGDGVDTAFGHEGDAPSPAGTHPLATGPGGTTAGVGPGGGGGNTRPPDPEPKRPSAGNRPRATGAGNSEEQAFMNWTGDEETDPVPGRPTRISMNAAAYLRTYETYPTLPESCGPPGRTSNAVMLEICANELGEVVDVITRRSTAPDYDAFLSNTIRTWRYRPLVVDGRPRSFCHLMIITYSRVSPASPFGIRPW
jgi:hypothetical protein